MEGMFTDWSHNNPSSEGQDCIELWNKRPSKRLSYKWMKYNWNDQQCQEGRKPICQIF